MRSLEQPVGPWEEVDDPNDQPGMSEQEIDDLLATEIDGVEPSWFKEGDNADEQQA